MVWVKWIEHDWQVQHYQTFANGFKFGLEYIKLKSYMKLS